MLHLMNMINYESVTDAFIKDLRSHSATALVSSKMKRFTGISRFLHGLFEVKEETVRWLLLSDFKQHSSSFSPYKGRIAA